MVVLPRFDPGEVLRTIAEQRITATMLVPSMLYALMDHPDAATADLSSLETVYYGASAINPVRLAEAIRRWGPIFAQYFGQSECPMVISYLGKADHDLERPERLASCGRPSPFLRTALLDGDGKPVAPGEPGEVCVAGPVLAQGYWNLPDETAETFRDGWLHTGDVAKADEDGFWYIVDRTKDMIVTGGFNVFPREVEDVIAEHPVGGAGGRRRRTGREVGRGGHRRRRAPSRCRHEPDAVARLTEEIQASVKERKGAVQSPKRVILADVAAADRAGQARQEGAARAVLGRSVPRGRLTGPHDLSGRTRHAGPLTPTRHGRRSRCRPRSVAQTSTPSRSRGTSARKRFSPYHCIARFPPVQRTVTDRQSSGA